MQQDARTNALILKFLRDRPEATATLGQIVDHLSSTGQDNGGDYSIAVDDRYVTGRALLARLGHLEAIGLIVIERKSLSLDDKKAQSGIQVRLSENFVDVQRAIGFSLTESVLRQGRSIRVTPVFERPRRLESDVFVIMPFTSEMSGVYDSISSCCKDLGLSVRRADDIFGATHVIHDIWSLICSAKLIICDCTGKNPNVFYELGIAHTLGKPVILVTQHESDVPFDLRHWRYLHYGADWAALSAPLANAIEAVLREQKAS
jgi:hypothetical protein